MMNGAGRSSFVVMGLALALAAAAACSVQTTTTPGAKPPDEAGAPDDDAGDTSDAGAADVVDSSDPVDPNYPTAHAPMPLVDFNGGAVIVAPSIVTITFGADPLRDRLEQFGDTITATPWWDAVREGYCSPESSTTTCVGRGSGGGHVNIATAPASPLTDSANGGASSVQDFLLARIKDGTLPEPTTNTIYAVYLPSGTSVTLDGATSCQQFGGYHNTLTATTTSGGDIPVAYAMIPRCDATEKMATIAASHEFIEAATDPNVGTGAVAYYMKDQVWAFAGGEVGDVCVDFTGAGQDTYVESGFTVQRTWSNKSAKASHDPCVPIPTDEVYFNAAPDKGQEQTGIKVGGSATVDITAYSDGPMADWDISAVDFNEFQTGKASLKFAFDKTTVHNGSKVKLTVTLTTNPGQFAAYAIVSRSGKSVHIWPAVVLKQ
jgi:hypothetical protein